MDEIPHSTQHRLIGIDAAVVRLAQELPSVNCVACAQEERGLLLRGQLGRRPALV
jgi:hypothetical protein